MRYCGTQGSTLGIRSGAIRTRDARVTETKRRWRRMVFEVTAIFTRVRGASSQLGSRW
jgi:hypothetical protein